MERYLPHLVRGAEQRTDDFLALQVSDPDDLQYGGMQGDIWEAKPTVYAMATAMAVYSCPQSRYHRSPALLKALERAIEFVERTQRADGCFDYPTCNFDSAPDTAFCFKRLLAAYRLMRRLDPEGGPTEWLQQHYRSVLHKAAAAIRDGGFHTPNHRWAIAAALMQGSNLFADEKAFAASLRQRAEQYLNEGIDCDADGDYSERSTGNYNAVVNNALMAIYQETGDEQYLDYVARNLRMMLTYFDPDDTIFNQNSSRQDRGRLDRPDKYFYQYLYLACLRHDPDFDAAAHHIIRQNMLRGDLAPDCLHILLRHEEMLRHHFTGEGFPATYRRYYPNAGVLRVKTPVYTCTVLCNRSDFLFFKAKDLDLHLRVGESYGRVRTFLPQDFLVTDTGCRLRSQAEGAFYLPFAEKPETSDWWAMDQTKREKLVNTHLTTTVEITELPDGIKLRLSTEGLDRLPLRLLIGVPADATLHHEAFQMDCYAGGSTILRQGMLRICRGTTVVELGPGFGEHTFRGHFSGEEQNLVGHTVCCTAYTPVCREITLRVLRG